jgi:multidrug efflux pump subunit AcrA (membrane-fusion protein)
MVVKRRWFIGLLILAVGVGGIFAYRKFFSKSEVKVLETAKIERGNVRGALVETGIIKSQVGAVVKIGSRATGTIVQMNVKIGDRVKKGDLIALIDDRETQERIQRQKAALEGARKTLVQVEVTYPQRIKEAQANLNYAKINFSREKELLKSEYTTPDALDKAENQYKALEANWRKLQDEYKTEVEISKAKVEEIAAQLKELEVTLSYTRIFAPIDGVVSDVTLQRGETIVAGLQVANLVTILDPTSLDMQIYVDETNIGKTKIGQQIEFYVDTFPEKTFRGTIDKIYPQPQTKDNIVYYLAIMSIPKDDAAFLKPEMTTHVKVIFEEKTDVLTVPNAAIKFEEGKQIAYKVVGPNQVEKLELKIGLRGEDNTEILSGAQEGDEVATKIILPVVAKQ